MKRALRMLPVACAALGAGGALFPMTAQAAITRPRLVRTDIVQSGSMMGVLVSLKITKADSTVPAKAKLCVLGKCKTTVITRTGLPASQAQAETITPNVAFKANRLNRVVTVKTTLTIGGHRYSYTSKAKDVKFTGG